MCMVSKEAKNVLLDHQRDGGFKKQGEALKDLLLKFKELVNVIRIYEDPMFDTKQRLNHERIIE